MTDSNRNLVAELVMGALRSEHGVRSQQARRRPTDYYAGRRAGFIASAAQAASSLYGADYDQAKHVLSEGVKQAGEGLTLADLLRPESQLAAAVVISDAALLS